MTPERHNLRKAFAAHTADQLVTARALTFIGDITGSGNFDGSVDLEIAVTIPKIPSTISATEISQLEGVSGNIQTQFDTLTTALGDVEAALDLILGL